MRRLIGAILAAAIAFAAPADAQLGRGGANGEPPCVLDKCLGQDGTRDETAPAAPNPVRPDRGFPRRAPLASGNFDFYVLALSWSPGFCDTGGADRSPDQCAAGRDLGFVVHGLWPQNAHGYPANCDPGSRFPSRAAFESVADLYPDVGLARHEWREHGTCSGLGPTDYFAAVRQARQSVTVPTALQQPREPLTLAPLDIARGFIAANPGLRADALAVTCTRGELAEVRLCLAKDLRGFVSCPEVARDACRTRAITVLPAR